MKKDLLERIDQIDEIQSLFHLSSGNGLPTNYMIYDVPEFLAWKEELLFELQDIHDRTSDNYIWEVLVLLKQRFNGWHDEKSFTELAGSLRVIQKNIDKYYPLEKNQIKDITDMQKKPKIFISHSSDDKEYVQCLVNFLDDIGLSADQMFCSSIPGYGIPLDEDIYQYLRQQFQSYDIHVFLILSKNYYESVACMNEMGAAWVLQSKYTTILLPEFKFEEIAGAINPRQIGLKLDDEITVVKEKLGELKNTLTHEFGLSTIPDTRWEQKDRKSVV